MIAISRPSPVCGKASSRPAATASRPRKADRARASRLLTLKLDYMFNDSFRLAETGKEILEDGLCGTPPLHLDSTANERQEPGPLQAWHLGGPYGARLLLPEEETWLFRKMNFLKFRADQLRKKLNPDTAVGDELDRIEELLAAASEVQARIVGANLRLVVSIAKKFASSTMSFDDMVSDGNMSLVRAVAKFDYDRGYRFSTYATYAIRRSLYRLVTKGRELKSRCVSDHHSLEALEARSVEPRLNEVQLHGLQASFAELLGRLDEREQKVLTARFGLDGSAPKTFRTLGQELGVCKERIRQLQARALQKLKAWGGAELSQLADL